MVRGGRSGVLVLACVVPVAVAAAQEEPAAGGLAMSPAVACEKIEGYEHYVEREGAALTKDEKLLVYYRPLNYKVERYKGRYRAHLTQDVRVRRHGAKAVLWKKDRLVDEGYPLPDPSTTLFIKNVIALKALAPGEYDLEIVLHDQLAKGATAVQTLRFQVQPSPATGPAPGGKSERRSDHGATTAGRRSSRL